MARQRSLSSASMSWIDPLESRMLLSSYVVSPTGLDSNAGTAKFPWATLQYAANHVVAGDSVTVRAGKYTGFVLGWDDPQNGTAKLPITFKAEAGAVITNRNSKTNDGINLEGTDYVIVDGFTIAPTSGDPWRAGIRSVQNTHAIIRNTTVQMRSADRYGIFSSFTKDLLVEKNNVSGTDNSGIYTSNSAERPIIRVNVVHSTGGNGLHFNGDVSQGGSGEITSALIERNTIYDTGKSAGGSAINMDGVQNSRIQNNVLYNNHAKGIALYQIDAAEGSKNNQILHNTVVMPADASGYALTIKNGSTGNQVFNNLLLSASPQTGATNISVDSLADFASDYNIVTNRFSTADGDSSMTLGDWKSVVGVDPHTTAPDPFTLFANLAKNDLRLIANSAAIDSADPGHTLGIDVTGHARPEGNGNDIGAYEYITPKATKVAAPTTLRAKTISATSAALTWNDKSSNETGFLIRFKLGPHGAWLSLARRGKNARSFTAKNLIAGQKYYFMVRAFNATSNSGYSNTASAILPFNPIQA